MSVSKARAIALDILRRVETEGAYASDLLHSELNTPSIKPEDAALATELTLGVLRWQRFLDFLLQPHLKKSVDRLDLPVALALRLGLYQLRFLSRVPARAAVNESVELVKRARKSSAASSIPYRSEEFCVSLLPLQSGKPSVEVTPGQGAVYLRQPLGNDNSAWELTSVLKGGYVSFA